MRAVAALRLACSVASSACRVCVCVCVCVCVSVRVSAPAGVRLSLLRRVADPGVRLGDEGALRAERRPGGERAVSCAARTLRGAPVPSAGREQSACRAGRRPTRQSSRWHAFGWAHLGGGEGLVECRNFRVEAGDHRLSAAAVAGSLPALGRRQRKSSHTWMP